VCGWVGGCGLKEMDIFRPVLKLSIAVAFLTCFVHVHYRKRIYGSPFNDIAPHEVYSGDLFTDGLAVDTDRQRLYFTGYNSSGDGVIARINLQRHGNTHHTVLTGLHNPRAIHLLTEKKYDDNNNNI